LTALPFSSLLRPWRLPCGASLRFCPVFSHACPVLVLVVSLAAHCWVLPGSAACRCVDPFGFLGCAYRRGFFVLMWVPPGDLKCNPILSYPAGCDMERLQDASGMHLCTTSGCSLRVCPHSGMQWQVTDVTCRLSLLLASAQLLAACAVFFRRHSADLLMQRCETREAVNSALCSVSYIMSALRAAHQAGHNDA
jgi:hypothetical protein